MTPACSVHILFAVASYFVELMRRCTVTPVCSVHILLAVAPYFVELMRRCTMTPMCSVHILFAVAPYFVELMRRCTVTPACSVHILLAVAPYFRVLLFFFNCTTSTMFPVNILLSTSLISIGGSSTSTFLHANFARVYMGVFPRYIHFKKTNALIQPSSNSKASHRIHSCCIMLVRSTLLSCTVCVACDTCVTCVACVSLCCYMYCYRLFKRKICINIYI